MSSRERADSAEERGLTFVEAAAGQEADQLVVRGLPGRSRVREKGLYLGGEHEEGLVLVVVERLDPKPVAGAEQPLPFDIVEAKCPHGMCATLS